MRPTWIVIGLIVAVGVVAYVKLIQQGEDTRADVELNRQEAATAPKAAPAVLPALMTEEETSDAEAEALEAKAREILVRVGQAHEARDRARYDEALQSLRNEAWDAPSARRFAMKLGASQYGAARKAEGLDRVRRFDLARRDMSRGVWLPELFDEAGKPTPERERLLAAIQAANQEVMTYARRENGGLAGVTRPYQVKSGLSPIQIVSREKLRYGPNALLYWNKGGNLDPTKLQAEEWLLLPEEELTLQVNLERKRLAIFLGDWLVKEFPVGVGLPESPTPRGTFTLGVKRQLNPDWDSPQLGRINYGDPRNELGDAWMGIRSDSVPESSGFGIHGTNKPDTVGSRCSKGCVRLRNAEAVELYRWVRSASAGGQATVIEIF